ncbi:MAG TPA: NUDIX hydrolase [Candidatus Avacidaminococcus intestinavium]|uniref:NUDIX hydrolase n=1 Tax=Candidatus Avacidaminococcus intestinavium TaxID=2840684 RepID=A0A9D1MPF7_9FIRM|nr:NUDIX hydrolase [Candidatus Avacidaminococcus intestinavium]
MKKFSKTALDEKLISTEKIFEGKLLKLDKDMVLLPNGKQATRELIRHPGAAAILAITNEQKIIFVEQYRHPVGSVVLEIPAGKIDPGEDPLTCAKRELSEETGFSAKKWHKLTSIATTPGFTDEVIHLYLAKELVYTGQHTDNDEFIEIKSFTLSEIITMISEGLIYDAKTLCALFAYDLNIRINCEIIKKS